VTLGRLVVTIALCRVSVSRFSHCFWLPVADTSRVENGKTINRIGNGPGATQNPMMSSCLIPGIGDHRTGQEKRHTSFSFGGTRNCLINSLRTTIWVDSNRRAKRVLTTVFKSRVGLFLKTHQRTIFGAVLLSMPGYFATPTRKNYSSTLANSRTSSTVRIAVRGLTAGWSR